MRVSEALETVGRRYIPGVVHHYAGMKTDPWQKAHDDLEIVMRMEDPTLTEVAAGKFVQECARLIDAFRDLGTAPQSVAPIDGFSMGDPDRVGVYMSRKHKHCVRCGSKEGLKLMSDPKDDRGVFVVCQECAA